jgi:hypothetical protein
MWLVWFGVALGASIIKARQERTHDAAPPDSHRRVRKIANDFNPVKFDADEWVRVAKAARMKYLISTIGQ